MSLLKGRLDSGNLFTAGDDIRGLNLIAPGTAPSYFGWETGDSVKHYVWFDDSDNFRRNTSAPTSANRNSAGTVMYAASAAGANTALSNVASVALPVTIASDTNLTDDLGTSSIYWQALYGRDLYLNSTATMKGTSAGQIDVVGKVEFGVDGTGYDIKFYGDSTGSFMLWDYTDDALELTDSTYLKFGDGADILMDWDGTDFNIDGSTDDYVVRFGEAADLDVIFNGYSSSYDCGWIADAKTFQFTATSILQFSGSSSMDTLTDGFKFSFDGTDTMNVDAVTANDTFRLGETTATDFYLDGASYDVRWDASADALEFKDGAELVFGSNTDGDVYIRYEGTGNTVDVGQVVDGTGSFDFIDIGIAMTGADSLGTMLAITGIDTTGNSDTMTIAHKGTGSALKLTCSEDDNVGLTVVGGSTQTTSMVILDGSTTAGGWTGADDVGMLHLKNDVALDHAGATMLLISSTGTPIAAAEGFLARFVDTGARTNATWAIQVDSADNACMRLVTGSTQDAVMTLVGATSSAGSYMILDGNSNGWLGADNTGMLHLQNDTAQDAGAAMLYVANSAQPVSAAEGFLARFVDTGTARTNAYAVEIEVTETTGALHCNGHAKFDRGFQQEAVAITATTAASPAACPDGVSYFTVTSTNANHVIQLPTPTPGTVVWLQGSTAGYELRSDSPASVAINGGSRASAECAIGANILVRAVCATATTWLATSWNASGVEVVVEQAS
jgi:hypothetical protein